MDYTVILKHGITAFIVTELFVFPALATLSNYTVNSCVVPTLLKGNPVSCPM